MKEKYLLRWKEFVHLGDEEATWKFVEDEERTQEQTHYVLGRSVPIDFTFTPDFKIRDASLDQGAWIANIGAWGGSHYFEATLEIPEGQELLSGQCLIGWALAESFGDLLKSDCKCVYDPALGVLWYEEEEGQIIRPYGPRAKSGDVLGASFNGGEIRFYINGEDLGVAAKKFGKQNGGLSYPRICAEAVTVKPNLVGPFQYSPEGFKAVGEVEAPEKLKWRSWNLAAYDILSSHPEKASSFSWGLYKINFSANMLSMFVRLTNPPKPENLHFNFSIVCRLLGVEASMLEGLELEDMEGFCLEKVDMSTNFLFESAVAFFWQKYRNECMAEMKKHNYPSPPMHQSMYALFRPLRCCEEASNPFRLEFDDVPEMTEEQQEYTMGIHEHPFFFSARPSPDWTAFNLYEPMRHVLSHLETKDVLSSMLSASELPEGQQSDFHKYFKIPTEIEELLLIDFPALTMVVQYLARYAIVNFNIPQESADEAFKCLVRFYFDIAPFEPIDWTAGMSEFFGTTYKKAKALWEKFYAILLDEFKHVDLQTALEEVNILNGTQDSAKKAVLDKYVHLKPYARRGANGVLAILGIMLPTRIQSLQVMESFKQPEAPKQAPATTAPSTTSTQTTSAQPQASLHQRTVAATQPSPSQQRSNPASDFSAVPELSAGSRVPPTQREQPQRQQPIQRQQQQRQPVQGQQPAKTADSSSSIETLFFGGLVVATVGVFGYMMMQK
eukprot:TRINITY_DN3449_c0_g1_i1.p1 TRINITY_DN3449_c0_g1~~TRINITY_DN3449_c0_g1_i1.p1  ORF type:complete len:803 (-),score=189.52 TRINITY_DN3449_c0_g1_i1:17-2194(-)